MPRSRNASNPFPLTRHARGPLAVFLGGLSLLVLGGCSQQPVSFETNSTFAAKLEQEFGEPMDEAQRDVESILVEAFGTPDEPRLPAVIRDDESLSGLIDPTRLARAAGAVSSDREGAHSGLYREHCSSCHGVSGDGRGPAAFFQNPYPRDYRAGVFKYKSTPRGAKPTRQDLAKTVLHGLPGTAMPAFELLAEEEDNADIEALLDYVVYLSIRGELERRLLLAAATEFDFASEDAAAQSEWVAAELREIAGEWAAADELVPSIPAPPESIASPESIAIGRELFHGQIANCASCHGIDGAGGRLPADYDDWTKEWTTQLGIDPKDRDKLKPFLKAGALPPRPLPARRLTLGGFRGGDAAEEIYLRIVHGIDGTPMPAINLVESESPTGLTTDQVWHLVHYVLSLPNSSSTQPPSTQPSSSDPPTGEVARGDVAAVAGASAMTGMSR